MIQRIYRPRLAAGFLAAWAALVSPLAGHPIPDVPVDSTFPDSGPAMIRVEIDPRCFEEDPESVLYTFKEVFEADITDEEKVGLLDKARAFVPKVLGLEYDVGGRFTPEFNYEFEFKDGAELEQEDDVVFIVAKARLPDRGAAKKYRIHARDHGDLSVIFRNEVGGKKLEQFQVLFPGETSYWLDLASATLLNPDRADERPESPPSKEGGGPLGRILLGVTLLLLVIAVVWTVLNGRRVAHGIE